MPFFSFSITSLFLAARAQDGAEVFSLFYILFLFPAELWSSVQTFLSLQGPCIILGLMIECCRIKRKKPWCVKEILL